jgi:hypothetical protein
MEAKEYLDFLQDQKAIVRLAHFTEGTCDGRGHAVIIDEAHKIAVMLESCGEVIHAGNIVKYVLHPESEPKIVGSPASIRR